ncbi:substrate-binding domain-containing protein [Rhodococcus spelaei]|uniref:substrate-binding domain-containing protein n=1 Tax=Rhodococcus spelaei TaxID=2546320 RepID=UPI001FEB0630|nr:substrate-binding domain-containing protein [Rhodococcus spelaei]
MSKGPIIAVVTVVVLVLAVLGWFQLRDRISDQGTQAAQTCVEGNAVLDVTADPDISAQISDFADRYNKTAPVVRDHCMTVSVTAEPSATTAAALEAGGGAQWAGTGPAPALWIPQSSRSVGVLVDHPGLVDGQPKSVAESPVILAASPLLAQALTITPTGWQDLPRLQSDPNSLPPLGLPGWGGLRLAMPTGAGSDATSLAAEAVAAGVSGAGTGPVTAQQAASAPVTAALSTLSLGSTAIAGGAPTTTADTLKTLAAQPTPATGPLHAVPSTEQQLYAATSAGAALGGVVLTGATPVADHPAAILAAQWVDETRSRAAAQFVDFLRQPEQADTLRGAGFRVDGTGPAGSEAVRFAPITSVLAPAPADVTRALTRVVQNPVAPRNSTVLLDISGSMSDNEGNSTRLRNTASALTAQVGVTPDYSNLGLWVYSKGLDGAKAYKVTVPTGPLAESIDGATRRQALDSTLNGLKPATATSTYASVEAAYAAAVKGFVAGRPNSILLITDGPNDDTSISSRQLLASIKDSAVDGKPVRVDVITIGENSDSATLRQLADQTGGTLVGVPSSDGPELSSAIGKLLA